MTGLHCRVRPSLDSICSHPPAHGHLPSHIRASRIELGARCFFCGSFSASLVGVLSIRHATGVLGAIHEPTTDSPGRRLRPRHRTFTTDDLIETPGHTAQQARVPHSAPLLRIALIPGSLYRQTVWMRVRDSWRGLQSLALAATFASCGAFVPGGLSRAREGESDWGCIPSYMHDAATKPPRCDAATQHPALSSRPCLVMSRCTPAEPAL
jgi:hypothetical protein